MSVWGPSEASADVLLLRHAPTSWNDHGRRQGWADRPLTADGRLLARSWTGDGENQFAAVVASDLRRARETAQIIAAELRLGDVVEFVGLREQDQGAWTGLTNEQVKRRWPERFRERPRRPVDGEPPEVVLERVLATLGCVAAAHEGGCVLVITHSEVIRTLEQAIGADAPPVPYLEGRWLRVAMSHVGGGEPGIGSVLPGALTVGRSRCASGNVVAGEGT